MRSLFEKVLAVMPVEVSRPIWDRYVEFEHTMVANGGDLATVAKVEARRALAFPDAPFVETKGLLSVAHRYSFLDLRPTSKFDQSFLDMYGASKRFASGDEAGDALGDAGGPGADGGGFSPEFERLIPGPALPDFLKEFASMLPLHLPWNGPIADADHIFRAMLMVEFPPRNLVEQRHQQQLQQKLAMQQQQAAAAERKNGDENGDDGSGVLSKRPAHDVFRSRQQQKLAKLG